MKNSVQEEKKIGKDFCKYELTILIHSYLNDEIVQKIVQFLEKKYGDKFEFCQSSIVGRYDILFNSKKIKVNMYTILFICCKATINDLKKVFKNTFTSDIIKHIIIKYNNCIMPKLDYKYPIEMKKYMFESMRIMPKDLTRLTSKEQRCLSINISIARELGLIDRSK